MTPKQIETKIAVLLELRTMLEDTLSDTMQALGNIQDTPNEEKNKLQYMTYNELLQAYNKLCSIYYNLYKAKNDITIYNMQ